MTSYKVGKGEYGSDIWAKSIQEASKFAIKRNIGEEVLGLGSTVFDGYGRKIPGELLNPDFRKINNYEFLRELPRIIHSACFLSYIAIKSGALRIDECLCDEGIVHELIHLLNNSELTERHINKVRGKFERLQSITPGAF